MNRFNDICSFISTVALAGLPLMALVGIAHLQALIPAAGL